MCLLSYRFWLVLTNIVYIMTREIGVMFHSKRKRDCNIMQVLTTKHYHVTDGAGVKISC
jgi:hypothetical protein